MGVVFLRDGLGNEEPIRAFQIWKLAENLELIEKKFEEWKEWVREMKKGFISLNEEEDSLIWKGNTEGVFYSVNLAYKLF